MRFTHHYLNNIPVSVFIAAGLFVTILCHLLGNYFPSKALIMIAVFLALVTFFWGRFFLCGISLGILAVGLNAEKPYEKPYFYCQFEAQITQPNYANHSAKVVHLLASQIRCGNEVLPNQVIQYWDDKHTLASYTGQRLQASADLLPITTRLNPHTPDYEKQLMIDGIRLRAKQLNIQQYFPESNLMLRAKVQTAAILQKKLSHQNAAILLALLTGNRSALTQAQKHTMQATGTSHLLAISGLHLALVGGVTWLIFQSLWALSWRLSDTVMPRNIGALATFLMITAYALFTGFDTPVQRAWLMFSLLIGSWIFARGATHGLLLAACLVMWISPYAVVSVGFYFSFIATFIVLWSSRQPYSPLAKVIIMQGVIGLALYPITWWVFGSISLSAFFVNLLVIPWLGFWVLPWVILATLLEFIFPGSICPLWSFVNMTTDMLWQVIRLAEQFELTLYPESRPQLIAVIVSVLTVILTLITQKKWLLFGTFLPVLSYKILVFNAPFAQPEIVIADRRYTSALIHNGTTAIIINPGRRYRQINEGKTWQRYLRQHHLKLGAIVLQNQTLTRISSTRWLLNHYPEAQVITLKRFSLPFEARFCQPIVFTQLELSMQEKHNTCNARLRWFNQSFILFPTQKQANAIQDKGKIRWQSEDYSAQALGAITIQQNVDGMHIDFMRAHRRLWRQASGQRW